MNILDVENPETIPTPLLPVIFEKQAELAEKYREIEGMGNLLTPEVVATNLDTLYGQVWMKDFAWRVTEELTESLEPVVTHKEVTEMHQLHYLEELADALHFITELCIIGGITAEQLIPIEDVNPETSYPIQNGYIMPMSLAHWHVTYKLGLFCNCLKNKKWKQTQMMTDRPKAIKYLVDAYEALILCFKQAGCSDADIYTLYFKKHAVNQFRQRTRY